MHHETTTGVLDPVEQILLTHPILEAYGPGFMDTAAKLAASHPEVADAYFTAYERLAIQAGNTAWMFPEVERETVRQSTIALLGSTVDTVLRHQDAGQQTKESIELYGRTAPAQADFYGTEPLMLLNTLAEAYWVAGRVSPENAHSSVRTTVADQGYGYAVYRFIDTAPDPLLPPCASIYVRSKGGDAHNPHREYGNSVGVAASMSLRVDVKLLREALAGLSTEMIGLSKSNAANNGVVSLRLDRAGVEVEMADGTLRRLPTTDDGTAEHDISSVLREDTGRLLSIGNTTLNHMKLSEELGRADTFERHIKAVEERIVRRAIKKPELEPIIRRQVRNVTESGPIPLFELGQNPYDYPGVRELAAYSGVELGDAPSEEELQRLFQVWGSQKAFRHNIAKLLESAPQLEHNELIRHIGRTGIGDAMPLRSIYGPVSLAGQEVNAVAFEGTAQWIEKRINWLIRQKQQGMNIATVALGATLRPLNTPTEVVHPEVVALQRQFHRTPTAVDFMHGPIRRKLKAAGMNDVVLVDLPHKERSADGSLRTVSGRDVAATMMQAYPELADGLVVDALNAPAGGMFYDALDAFTEVSSGFSPAQFLMGHGRNRIASTHMDNITTGLFQNAYSAPSSLIRWLNSIHKLNQRYRR